MYNYNTLCHDFLQYKKYLGYKYKTDTIVMNEIKKYLLDNQIETITKEITENYARLNPNLNSSTLARNMGVFREFCKYLKLQGINCYQIPNKLYPKKTQNYIPYIFTREEIKKIFSNLNINDNNYRYTYSSKISYPIIIKILYQTGMRIGEVLNLKIQDYNEEQGFFCIKDTKNEEERLVTLPDKLNEIIMKFHKKFHYNKSSNENFFEAKTGIIEKYFYKVLKFSGIERCENSPRLHDLRHTFVVHSIEKLYNEGKDINAYLPILQTYIGHQSLESLAYYFHLTNNILKEINKISNEKLGYLIRSWGGDSNE